MVIYNGKKYAETEKEFINSLFVNGGSCDGYATVNRLSVSLYDAQHNHIERIKIDDKVKIKSPKVNPNSLYNQAYKVFGDRLFSVTDSVNIPEKDDHRSIVVSNNARFSEIKKLETHGFKYKSVGIDSYCHDRIEIIYTR